jgi:hypothetical protein
MFCPVCRTEYRPGFRECSDCRLPLVDKLPTNEVLPATNDSDDLDRPVKLWDGVDPRTFAAIRASLDASSIFYDAERKMGPFHTLSVKPLEIWVQKRDEEAARKILSDVSGDDWSNAVDPSTDAPGNRLNLDGPPDNAPPEESSHVADSAEDDQVDDSIEDFDPEQATCEVWAGGDEQMAQIFNECLRNVGIGSLVTQESGKVRVLVLASSEKRAREIIREIVEQTPLE